VTGQPWQPPVYDVHPADQAISEATRRAGEAEADPLHDYWSSMEFDRDLRMKEGWPRASAEYVALQRARELAIRKAQAGKEAGQ
jgi:hypothetical protein